MVMPEYLYSYSGNGLLQSTCFKTTCIILCRVVCMRQASIVRTKERGASRTSEGPGMKV